MHLSHSRKAFRCYLSFKKTLCSWVQHWSFSGSWIVLCITTVLCIFKNGSNFMKLARPSGQSLLGIIWLWVDVLECNLNSCFHSLAVVSVRECRISGFSLVLGFTGLFWKSVQSCVLHSTQNCKNPQSPFCSVSVWRCLFAAEPYRDYFRFVVAAVTEQNMFVINKSRRCVLELWVQHDHETWPVFHVIFGCDLALFIGEGKFVLWVPFFSFPVGLPVTCS